MLFVGLVFYFSFAVAFFFVIIFFFSSRRRHTRFDCDWSSECALPISWAGPARPRIDRSGPGAPRARASRSLPVRRAPRWRLRSSAFLAHQARHLRGHFPGGGPRARRARDPDPPPGFVAAFRGEPAVSFAQEALGAVAAHGGADLPARDVRGASVVAGRAETHQGHQISVERAPGSVDVAELPPRAETAIRTRGPAGHGRVAERGRVRP